VQVLIPIFYFLTQYSFLPSIAIRAALPRRM
jgi:hypothetical protein